jgi:hypothetical protein
MTSRVNIRSGMADAFAAFRRYPVVLSFPMVCLGLGSWGWGNVLLRFSEHTIKSLLVLALALPFFWVTCFVEVLVAAMYLKARSAERPSLVQAGEVAHYSGFASYIGSLFARYVGWVLVLAIIVGVIVSVIAALWLGTKSSGIGVFAGGVSSEIPLSRVLGWLIGGAVVAAVWSRYQLAMPMFAIFRGNRTGLFDESVQLSKSVWIILTLAMLASVFPSTAVLAVGHALGGHWAPSYPLKVVLELIQVIFDGFWMTWFILFRTEIALQVLPKAEVATSGEGFLPGAPEGAGA